jgi:hypothetical protein
MTTWTLDPRMGWRLGLAFVALFLLLAAGLITLLVTSPISLLSFFLVLGALGALGSTVYLGFRLGNFVRADYEMDRNAIVVNWGAYGRQIPLAAIQRVCTVDELEQLKFGGVLRWPGYLRGRGYAENVGPIHFYAGAPLKKLVFLCLEDRAYAISPAERALFLEALEERRTMGPTQDVTQEEQHPAFLDWTIWRDRRALVPLGLSVLLLMLLAAVLSWRYPTLPDQIIMKISASGRPLLVAPRARIGYLGGLGVIFALINGGLGLFFYTRQRMAAYLLWGGLVLLESSLWIAILSILTTS